MISGLTPNTKYYYRMRYSTDSGATWVARPELSFQTQRATGSTFKFTITTDSHVNIQLGSDTTWQNTLNDIKDDGADFEIDLGDTFAMDNGSTSVPLGATATAEQKYKDQLPYFNTISGSSPIYIVPGNHEQQEAWHLQGTLATQPARDEQERGEEVLPEPCQRFLLQRRYGHVFLPERRPVETGLLCLDVGRCAVRGDQSLLDHDHQTVHNLDGRR